MSFDYRLYVEKFLAEPGNRAREYGVEIIPAMAGPGEAYRCLGVWHLLPRENGGKHNIFCEVVDENGQRLTGATILILNHEGGVRGRMVIDKPLNEPGTNTHIHSNETLGLLVEGLPGSTGPSTGSGGASPTSDRVRGLHTRHADEPGGNTWGHHSYFVLFQRGGDLPPAPPAPPDPPADSPPDPPEGGEEWLKEVDAWVAAGQRLARRWKEIRERMKDEG